jgi:hypothetical protein
VTRGRCPSASIGRWLLRRIIHTGFIRLGSGELSRVGCFSFHRGQCRAVSRTRSRGQKPSEGTTVAGCARATVYRTVYRFEDLGEDRLLDRRGVSRADQGHCQCRGQACRLHRGLPRRGRPRAGLRIPVRGHRKILRKIDRLVKEGTVEDEVFYVDEADIDLRTQPTCDSRRRGLYSVMRQA